MSMPNPALVARNREARLSAEAIEAARPTRLAWSTKTGDLPRVHVLTPNCGTCETVVCSGVFPEDVREGELVVLG